MPRANLHKPSLDRKGIRFMKAREVLQLIGLGRTTLWKLEREGKFPKGFRLAGLQGTKVWLEADVLEWMREQMRPESC